MSPVETKGRGVQVSQPVTLFDTTPIITTTLKPAEANSPAHPSSSSEGCPQTPEEQLAPHYTQSTKDNVILSVLWTISMQPMNLHTLSKLRLANLFTK